MGFRFRVHTRYLRIVADAHERASGVPDELEKLGLDVQLRTLWAGDYVLEKLAIVERKNLLIEGGSVYDGPLSAEAMRGLLLAVDDLGISVVMSANGAETATWIRRSFERPRTAPAPPPERALAAATGVSTVTAKAVLARFGCLRDVLVAEPTDLVSVPGVGPAKARAIHALGSEQLAIPAKPE